MSTVRLSSLVATVVLLTVTPLCTGSDSHMSPDGEELILFEAAQVLLCENDDVVYRCTDTTLTCAELSSS
jgi:hypothetical protein